MTMADFVAGPRFWRLMRVLLLFDVVGRMFGGHDPMTPVVGALVCSAVLELRYSALRS
jgi:hypothetical protein